MLVLLVYIVGTHDSVSSRFPVTSGPLVQMEVLWGILPVDANLRKSEYINLVLVDESSKAVVSDILALGREPAEVLETESQYIVLLFTC